LERASEFRETLLGGDLFALEHPTGPPRAPNPDAPAGVPTEALAAVTYDQQLLAKAPITQAVRYTMRSATVGTFAAVVKTALARGSRAFSAKSAHSNADRSSLALRFASIAPP